MALRNVSGVYFGRQMILPPCMRVYSCMVQFPYMWDMGTWPNTTFWKFDNFFMASLTGGETKSSYL